MATGLTIPFNATPLGATSGSVAAAVAAATLAADANQFNWLTGFDLTGSGATAASTIAITVTGLVGGTITFLMVVPAGAALAASGLSKSFPIPLRSSAKNIAIVVSSPSFGAGNLAACMNAYGYKTPE